ncbi:hypothetical protein EIP86_005719 [Pleurotus ostreatoroseus]|nr:hypothetical protein EIP86_005719 [Pleurotus ostreatoroseus]
MFTVVGFFPLARGHREPANLANGLTRYHNVYDTDIRAVSFSPDAVPALYPAKLRIFSPNQADAALPHGTVAFVAAKVATDVVTVPGRPDIPPKLTVLMDGVIITGCPGDPSNADAYDAALPDVPSHFVSCAGVIQTSFETAADGNNSKAFTIKVQEYVHGTKRWSTVQCLFSARNARWNTFSLPAANTWASVFGMIDHQRTDGTLAIRVESVETGPNDPANVGGGALPQTLTAGSPASPSKKRKYWVTSDAGPSTSMPTASSGLPVPQPPEASSSCLPASGQDEGSSSSSHTLDDGAAPPLDLGETPSVPIPYLANSLRDTEEPNDGKAPEKRPRNRKAH